MSERLVAAIPTPRTPRTQARCCPGGEGRLRATGDADVFALFGEPDPDAPFDREACAAVGEIADRAGAGRLVALDLYTEFLRPGWSPFPAPGAEERIGADLEGTIP